MLDGFELWLRKIAGPLFMGIGLCAVGVAEEGWWLPFRLLFAAMGMAAFWECVTETWKLLRSKESTKAQLDRLENEAWRQ
ncbi:MULTISPECIES: hypothetical protein [unclassified Streptomyces]|uniref:hypothetical protein n=1 Tax=unclassified Streptomyces TaxID=2593676 RepID=UPI0004BD081C|nr:MULTISPECIES: hypothetical protein [unclassified Streptomyces]